MTLKRQKGFTLIELLIVITIIGILAVALVPRLTGGQERARDAQRKADLQQIATALEFYADDDADGAYPSETANCLSELVTAEDLDSYLTTVPSDPKPYTSTTLTNGCTDNEYTYVSLTDGYMLIAVLENQNDNGDNVYNAFDTSTAYADISAVYDGEDLCSSYSGTCAPVYVIGR